MTIETKFELGDKAYYMSQNKIKSGTIEGMTIKSWFTYGVKEDPQGRKQMVKDEDNRKVVYEVYYEIGTDQVKQLFKTKEELLNSL